MFDINSSNNFIKWFSIRVYEDNGNFKIDLNKKFDLWDENYSNDHSLFSE